MLSLNEPAEKEKEEEEIRGGRGLEKPGQDSRDVIYRSKSYLNNIPTYRQTGWWYRIRAERGRRRNRAWLMQPAFSPLCMVSARITTVEEEEEEEEEDSQRERCIQTDVPLLSYKTGPVGFALYMLPQML
ncbi:hypothetical protein ILYODFUR_027314 [Ilyodon furcidens]|uniref:Uncharacterized protein n=1 Tax=Ilyodon furcidens TaxID=33524 RepID=A0ABV0TQ15_9TELE